MKPAIRIENLSKLYHIGPGRNGSYRTLREAIVDASAAPWRRLARRFRSAAPAGANGRPSDESHWSLRDVSFEVRPGEVIGIIGRNGAGKSTLLKVVSRITEPSAGRVELRGRVGSLLEVGTGFHNELSGRENIYLNGAILGMSRREITRKFDQIVAFAEVERFLDTPVKRYSSGMYVRLAFAVASYLETEILVVDEVLAVGDAAFQKKCLGMMDEASRTGRTILLVSHNMAAILNLCQRVVLLDRGHLAFEGACQDGVERYNRTCGAAVGATHGGEVDLADSPHRRPGCLPIVRRLRMFNGAGEPTDRFYCGEKMTFEVHVDPGGENRVLHLGVGVEDTYGVRLFTVATYLTDSPLRPLTGPSRLVGHVDQMTLAPGTYRLSLNAGPIQEVQKDAIDQAAEFTVVESDYYGNGRIPHPSRGPFLVRSKWENQGPPARSAGLEPTDEPGMLT
ncbi:MAG TPA: ABC transporter ATP-binding protein [Isosphaeraceae bacterium]|jgi:lipopolysaccharide transport system ATP-binding protein